MQLYLENSQGLSGRGGVWDNNAVIPTGIIQSCVSIAQELTKTSVAKKPPS
jgi:hypothetical protein